MQPASGIATATSSNAAIRRDMAAPDADHDDWMRLGAKSVQTGPIRWQVDGKPGRSSVA
jgi:hypothetical protein